MEQVNILWTGGLDSTCRVCELSLMNVIVQPYYLRDPQRDSVKYELKAIKTITSMLREKSTTKCELRDVIVVEVDSLQPDDNIRAAWRTLRGKYRIGTQYDWLARFTKQHNLTVEMSLESSPRSKSMNALKGDGALIEDNEHGVPAYRLDTEKCTPELVTVFENLRFPTTLWNMTKEEEVAEMRANGMEDIMKKTWFCYSPMFGLPCGHCSPCRDALNEGMEWRVPMAGRVMGFFARYTYHAARHVIRRIKKKYD